MMKTASRWALCGLAALTICRGQGVLTTVAGSGSALFSGDGGPAIGAGISSPLGLAADGAGNLYIADIGNYRVRKVSADGTISTYAGSGAPGITGDGGPAINAKLFSILSPSGSVQGMAVDKAGNLYITDNFNHRVRKITPAGVISLFAGGGLFSVLGDGKLATKAGLPGPTGVALDSQGNVYIADNTRIRKVDTAGIITTVAGNGTPGYSGDGGPANAAQFEPEAIAVDTNGNLYITDSVNHNIRKVNHATGIISTIAGSDASGVPPSGDGGPATSAVLYDPTGIAVDNAGNIYVADAVHSGPGIVRPAIRKIDTAGIITTVVGASAALVNIADVTVDPQGNVYLTDSNIIHKYSPAPGPHPAPVIAANGVVNAASFQPGIVANSWVTISGTDLASKTDTWSHSIVNGKLPTSLDGVSVTIGGKPAYVYFVSPNQINVLAPDINPGPVLVTVTNAGGTSNTFPATASQYSPAFFEWPNSQPVATRQDYSYAAKAGTFAGTTTVAAKPGDVLILWGTGFGATNPAAPVGVPVPAGKTYSTASKVTVTVGNIAATVYGAALASGAAGLYQVAIKVPDTLADGDWPIQATIGGVKSPAGVLLTVQR